ncbi:MAG TPA: tetratricopeptide repeat protein [Anaeromyxobacteraceae bacterium]|nr:tetratricopeptide repeat protein [Anaeromyxobacteraceae bacterium]
MWGYRARDVSRLVGLAEAEVRRYAREGFVPARRGPRGEWRFAFQDLVLLRAAAGLAKARLPAARVRRALERLKAQLPAGRSLAAVHVSADGDQVVVRDGGAAWQPETGQLVIDFDVREVARRVAPLVRRASGDGPARGAEEFYEWGCDLEPGAPEEAAAAYRRALALEPRHAGAHLNLGRLLHERGDPAAAERHYRLALTAGGPTALAAFNLGIALEDQGRPDEALFAYEAALDEDPRLADAHFNAARLLEARGRKAEALRHLGAYRRLGPSG